MIHSIGWESRELLIDTERRNIISRLIILNHPKKSECYENIIKVIAMFQYVQRWPEICAHKMPTKNVVKIHHGNESWKNVST